MEVFPWIYANNTSFFKGSHSTVSILTLHCLVMTREGFNKPRKYCFSESFLTNENISTAKYSIFNCVPISNLGLLYYGHSTDAAPSTAEA